MNKILHVEMLTRQLMINKLTNPTLRHLKKKARCLDSKGIWKSIPYRELACESLIDLPRRHPIFSSNLMPVSKSNDIIKDDITAEFYPEHSSANRLKQTNRFCCWDNHFKRKRSRNSRWPAIAQIHKQNQKMLSLCLR